MQESNVVPTSPVGKKCNYSQRRSRPIVQQKCRHEPETNVSNASGILQCLDESTLLEVMLRLPMGDICRAAATCRSLAQIARREWLWQQMCFLAGITCSDSGGSRGWRSAYAALRHVHAVDWQPLPMSRLASLAEILQRIGIPAGHSMICVDLRVSTASDDPTCIAATHPAPFTFQGTLAWPRC
jgi:hypothetical protein